MIYPIEKSERNALLRARTDMTVAEARLQHARQKMRAAEERIARRVARDLGIEIGATVRLPRGDVVVTRLSANVIFDGNFASVACLYVSVNGGDSERDSILSVTPEKPLRYEVVRKGE